jgi:hypothetical protein
MLVSCWRPRKPVGRAGGLPTSLPSSCSIHACFVAISGSKLRLVQVKMPNSDHLEQSLEDRSRQKA